MKRLLGPLLIVVVGCTPPPPSPSVPPTGVATGRPPTPSAVVIPTQPGEVALAPCGREQVRLTPGTSGAAAGTNYLTVFAELAQGPACTLPSSPMIAVRTADGTEVARATETEPRPVALTSITRYYIAWSGDCRPLASGALVAHIDFSSTLAVDMPIGSFRPSCVDGIGQSLSMYADEPAS